MNSVALLIALRGALIFYWTRELDSEMTQSTHFIFVLLFRQERIIHSGPLRAAIFFSLCISQKKKISG
jgi:hypothetical protein